MKSQKHGSVVLGPGGAEIPLAELRDGEGPMAVFGPGAADAVRRTDGFPHVADVMVNSMHDPETGRVHAFEEQIGSHGGLGGEQSRPFLLWPRTLTDPLDAMAADLPPGTSEAGPAGIPQAGPVGAEAVHRVLARWLRELSGPQVPLQQEGFTGAVRVDEPFPEGVAGAATPVSADVPVAAEVVPLRVDAPESGDAVPGARG